ncbi:hypothetical protein, partial [Nocardia pseudovaccinii]|uniref:hypothetical protein n=1 Tax=Nocardia pseudovaccinii TaxID=189540 RepID=UPI001C3F8CA0
ARSRRVARWPALTSVPPPPASRSTHAARLLAKDGGKGWDERRRCCRKSGLTGGELSDSSAGTVAESEGVT